jgi:hypothetical protein
MLDGSPHLDRSLRAEEKAILTALLSWPQDKMVVQIDNAIVQDMNDGNMGSIRFVQKPDVIHSLGKTVAEAEYVDADGVTVSIAVSVDDRGHLYEVDFWKVDFSPLRKYPKPEQLSIKHGQTDSLER